jgi:hypothetical protein
MELRERIAELSRWPGWRRYAPVAGSIVSHVFLGMALISMLAAAGKPRPVPTVVQPRLEVTLVAETPPPPRGIRPTPPEAPKAPPRSDPRSEPLPAAPPVARDPRKDQKQQQAAAQPAIAGGVPSDDKGGVYLGDSDFALSGVPLGLRGLLETDPCRPKNGLPRGECGPSWKEKLAQGNLLEVPTRAQLRRMYPGIIPPCPYKVGCEGGEWISTNGTRSVAKGAPGSRDDRGAGSPMASGAAGLGGVHDIVGRLGFNPDHTDPGFGD